MGFENFVAVETSANPLLGERQKFRRYRIPDPQALFEFAHHRRQPVGQAIRRRAVEKPVAVQPRRAALRHLVGGEIKKGRARVGHLR